MQRIIEGVERFLSEVVPEYQEHLSTLATGQKPEALFISCADSRVDTGLMTQTRPGTIFHLRNAGNIVPPYTSMMGAEAATIEYAMSVLEIPNIVLCGHTNCGAMKALLNEKPIENLPAVSRWLTFAETASLQVQTLHGHLGYDERLSELIEQNTLTQLLHLQTHPSVATRVAQGKVHLYAWVYDVATGQIRAYNDKAREFVCVKNGFQPVPAFVGRRRNMASVAAVDAH
jgi:carbonic anhydrase